MIRPVALSLFALLLISCTGPQPEEVAPFVSKNPPIRLTVAEVVTETEASAAGIQDYFARRRTERLIERTEDFIDSRFEAAGGIGWARVLITQASIEEIPKETTAGVKGALTRESDRVLDASVAVKVAIMDGFGIEQAYAEARVERQRGILEKTSVVTRDAEVDRLIADLLQQLDQSLTQAVNNNLGPFRTFGPPA